MLGCMAWGGHHPQGEPPQVDLLAVLEPAMSKAEPASAGRVDLGAGGGGQLAAAGQKVSMQMGLDHIGDLEPPPAGQLQIRGRVAGRVDH
jgi:hypothetical protein